MNERLIKGTISFGIFFILTAIILGAVSTHILKTHGLPADNIASFNVGIRYQMYSGLGLLLIVSLRDIFKFSLLLPTALLIFGTFFFCITVYLLTTQSLHDLPVAGMADFAPIGGGAMILSWTYLLVRFLIQKK